MFAHEDKVLVDPEQPVAFGLGAQLPEPSMDLFMDTFWRGGDVTVGLESRTGSEGFGDLLEAEGFVVEVRPGEGDVPEIPAVIQPIGGQGVNILVSSSERPFVGLDAGTVVIGIGEKLPVVIAVAADRASILDPARAGLPGVVSPYDLIRTLANELGVAPPAEAPGAVAEPVAQADALRLVSDLSERFRSDLGWRKPVASSTIALILVASIIGIAAAARRWDRRAPSIAACAILGAYLGSLAAASLPLGGWPPRVLLVIASAAISGWFGRDPGLGRRTAALGASATIIVSLAAATLAASLIGQGPIALALWPSPLEASRASGLVNGYCVLLIGALLAAYSLGLFPRRVFVALGVGVVALITLPALGANYGGGVLAVIAIGGCLLIEPSGRLRLRALLLLGMAAVVVLGAALLLDIGGQTHGGRFVTALREGGFPVLLDTLRGRLETSAVVIGRFGWIAWLGYLLMIPVLVVAAVGAFAPKRVPVLRDRSPRVRACAAGLLLAALAALVVEDTSFLTAGGLLGFIIAVIIPPETQPAEVAA